MRLLNTKTFTFAEYYDLDIPEYAILSHRWEVDEVTFKDVSNHSDLHKAGWIKLSKCCAFALKDGYQWVWVDTCCIDKSSSAELTEAINSMFKWYKNSGVCYAYLYDVAPIPEDLDHDARLCQLEYTLKQSEWFTRSWTLQELIAPKYILFIASDWTSVLGTKESLKGAISRLTEISEVGRISTDILKYSVARRMSWASTRRCTRIEDTAYSLMGIFNVNMPLLYGEGQKAFLRLQLEILKASNDESIFAWRYSSDGVSIVPELGMLALSPLSFQYSGGMEPYMYDYERPPFSMTSKGLQFEPRMVGLRWSRTAQQWESTLHNPSAISILYVVGLNCCSREGRAYVIFKPTKLPQAEKEMFLRFRSDLPLTISTAEQVPRINGAEWYLRKTAENNEFEQRKRIYVPQPNYQTVDVSAYRHHPPECAQESIQNAVDFVRKLDPRQTESGLWRYMADPASIGMPWPI